MKRILNSAVATSVAAAALATVLAMSTATALTFTNQTLINGWTTYSSAVHAPAAALDSKGVVHLRGGIKTAGNNATAFVLGATFRPNKIVYVVTNLCGAAPGRLIINPNGNVLVQPDGPFSDAQCFTSLEGVTFGRQ